jgi:hypothetical protein
MTITDSVKHFGQPWYGSILSFWVLKLQQETQKVTQYPLKPNCSYICQTL